MHHCCFVCFWGPFLAQEIFYSIIILKAFIMHVLQQARKCVMKVKIQMNNLSKSIMSKMKEMEKI